MKLQELEGKKILILGYGKEGQATELYLRSKLHNITLGIADRITDPSYLDKQKDFDIAIKTPGIPAHLVTIPYTTATNIFFSEVPNIKIGVTGSKGKSTTAALIHHMLKAAGKQSHLAGNIGNPLLDELQHPIDADDVFVCELSSYQLADLDASPQIAVITTLFPEHMNYHGSVGNYYAAKKNIIAHIKPDDYYIYNRRIKELNEWAAVVHCRNIAVDIDPLLSSIQVPLIGDHNMMNCSIAIAVARVLHVPDNTIKDAIESFKSLPHRLEFIGEFKGIRFYDDAISTAPESTIEAVRSLKNVGTIFLGGEDRGYDYRMLVRTLKEYHVGSIVLFPQSGQKILDLIKSEYILQPALLETDSMQTAVEFAYKHTPAGSICLLSTAAPSYSLWKNFEAKGEEFKKWVHEKNT